MKLERKFDIGDLVVIRVGDDDIDYRVQTIVSYAYFNNAWYYITDKNMPAIVSKKAFSPVLLIHEDEFQLYDTLQAKFFKLENDKQKEKYEKLFKTPIKKPDISIVD